MCALCVNKLQFTIAIITAPPDTFCTFGLIPKFALNTSRLARLRPLFMNVRSPTRGLGIEVILFKMVYSL